MISTDTPLRMKIAEYFEEFLPSKIGQLLLPDVRCLTSRFSVVLREDPRMHWAMRVEGGVLMMVSRSGMPTDCRFSVDGPTLLAIVCGRLGPQQAFFQRRVDIGGDIAAGLKTAAVMAKFFQDFPFQAR